MAPTMNDDERLLSLLRSAERSGGGTAHDSGTRRSGGVMDSPALFISHAHAFDPSRSTGPDVLPRVLPWASWRASV
jgi:hypothetical protein